MEASDLASMQNLRSIVGFYDFLVSPPIMVGAIWWLVRRFFTKQEKLLSGLTTTMDDVKIKIALHESRASSLDDALKNANKMQEDITILKAKVDAAFRLIDHLTSFEKDVERRLKPAPKPPEAA